MAESRSSSSMSGAIGLSQDIATLINNRQGSDVQFKVGGRETATLPESGEIVYDELATITIYAHSIILRCRSRYFAAMLDDEKQWKEGSEGVIYKPNISPTTFLDVLYYIYTGNVRARSSENLIELITAAEEMGLEELSFKCQAELIRTVKLSLSGEEDNEKNEEETSEELTKRCLPIDVAIPRLILPALKLANNHTLSYLLQQLLSVMIPRMTVITASPGAYTIFVDGISLQILTQILASDSLAMKEKNVWDLALDWACHQTKLLRSAVEVHLRIMNNAEDDGDDDDDDDETVSTDGIDNMKEQTRQPLVSVTQLKQLKTILAPLLPVIRFSLIGPEDYAHMDDILSYFLSRHRFLELQRFFANSKDTRPLDMLRTQSAEQKIPSVIVVEPTTWKLLKKYIFEAGGISGCSSLHHLKFKLLFRASVNGFRAGTFHECCDNKGPTLNLIKSSDGRLFGGVNFADWDSSSGYISTYPSNLNFLFALPDGHHRQDSLIFKYQSNEAVYNNSSYGPTFGGGHDLYVVDFANTNQDSYTELPSSYNGSMASSNALAGAYNFMVSDYEVFAISKK